MSETTTIRLSFVIASICSILWLGFSFWAMSHDGAAPQGLYEAVITLGTILMPVAAMYALASALQQREHIPILDKSSSLEETEARLSGAAARIDALKNSLATELSGLAETADALEIQSRGAQKLVADLTAASTAAIEASRSLEEVLPKAAIAAVDLRNALMETGNEANAQAERANQSTQLLTSGLTALSASGAEATDKLSGALQTLESQAIAGRAQSEAGIRAIRGEADSLFELLENTAVAKRESMVRHLDSMVNQMNETYQRFEAMANAAAGKLAERLQGLAGQAEEIEGRLSAHARTTETLAASGERAFHLLDARLQHSSENSRVALDKLASRVQDVNVELGSLATPLKSTQTAAQELTGAVKALKETALQTVDVLAETLPTRTVEASRAAETLSSELNTLVQSIDRAHDRALGLAQPIADSRAKIEAASESYAAQRVAIEDAGHALVVELQQAQTLIAQVEEQTRDTSLAAASRLVDAMTQVRSVATQATGSMREMLNGLLEETRESLSATANDTMRVNFAEPVARLAEQAEMAATAAAERTAASMAALANTLKLLEDRSSDRMEKFESASQEELLAAASLLTDRLSQSAVSISSALGRPMDDADWTQWKRGERGLFNKRTLALLEKKEARELKALLASDEEFARAARDYTNAFQSLAQRFEAQVPLMAAALMGSEHGRLAAALSEALEG